MVKGESLFLPLRPPLPQAEAGRKGAIYAKPCAVRGPLEQGLIRIGIAHGRKEFSDFAQRRPSCQDHSGASQSVRAVSPPQPAHREGSDQLSLCLFLLR